MIIAMTNEPEFLTTAQVCELLKISPTTLRTGVEQGTVPAPLGKVRNAFVYDKQAIISLCSGNKKCKGTCKTKCFKEFKEAEEELATSGFWRRLLRLK